MVEVLTIDAISIQVFAPMNLPTNDLIIPWSGTWSGGKKNLHEKTKFYMFKSMRYGNASEIALVPVTFECMSYQALNLYHMNYVELHILFRYYSPKFSVW